MGWSKRTQQRADLKSGGGSLAMGTYFHGGSPPPPPGEYSTTRWPNIPQQGRAGPGPVTLPSKYLHTWGSDGAWEIQGWVTGVVGTWGGGHSG